MSNTPAFVAEPPDWSRFLRLFAGAAALFAFVALTFAVLVDPYGTNPLRLRFERPLMDINQRFMFPQVLRSGRFDSAVFGTSTARLLKPAELEAAFGGHFGNFAMNAATPFEQSQEVRLYLRSTPGLRTLVWGLDISWCEPNADAPDKLFTERSFPSWLYRRGGVSAIPHLFNLRTLEIAARVVLARLGLAKPRLPPDGYEVFTPPEASYDLERARAHIWGTGPRHVVPTEPAFVPSAAERGYWRLPALAWLDAALAPLPPNARPILMFPPVHVAAQFPPGSEAAAVEAVCKERIAAIAAAHRGIAVDFRFASPITTKDENYWDPLHFRLPFASLVIEALRRAAAGESGDDDFRVVRPDGA